MSTEPLLIPCPALAWWAGGPRPRSSDRISIGTRGGQVHARRGQHMSDELQERRKWFQAYFESGNAMVRKSRPKQFWCTCPVCGYPTLGERGGFEICILCWWEDDGQDDPNADEVWGGPNGKRSLTEARRNFAAYRMIGAPGT